MKVVRAMDRKGMRLRVRIDFQLIPPFPHNSAFGRESAQIRPVMRREMNNIRDIRSFYELRRKSHRVNAIAHLTVSVFASLQVSIITFQLHYMCSAILVMNSHAQLLFCQTNPWIDSDEPVFFTTLCQT